MDYIDEIDNLGACCDAIDWLRAEQHPTIAAAWAACNRGDWMLWLAGHCAGPVGDPRRVPLALAAADCAELALPHVAPGDGRPRQTIDTLRAWARGEATIDEVRAAAWASADAASAAGAARAAAMSAAAADAAWVAAARVAWVAADAAKSAADWVAGADAWAAARAATLAQCADIVRRHYPEPPTLPVLPV